VYFGENKIYIECKDETGDSARGETEFSILFDGSSPQITRIWQENGKLYLITDEISECSYSIKDCNSWDEEKTTPEGKKHIIEISRGQIYYIKCRDEFGNLPSGCSVIINPI
jgi:hypothetical protein